MTEISSVADLLIDLMPEYKIFAFEGPLGAGKTTLVSEILKKCGVTEPITSPTFTYLNVYENSKNQLFYHFDLYRIGSLDDFLAAGFDEYLSAPKSWTFIEWPEVIMPLLTESVCLCTIDYHDQKRSLTINI